MPTNVLSPLHIRRSIWIAASPERIWQEFETFDRMAAWFGTGHRLVRFDPGPGGRVELEIDGEWRGSSRWGGAITVWDPPPELTFEDRWMPDLGWEGPMLLTFRLTAYNAGTLVELFIHDIEATGPGAAETHAGGEGGWTVRHLAKLKEIVEGSRP
jgi:uncharacterized protein YndB with AHSA1/START domain